MMKGWPRWPARREDGSVAVMAALCMVMFVGCLGLVLDGGVMYVHRTQLQKAVDAAALAGAYDIGVNSNSASDAKQYAKLNQVDPSSDANTALLTNASWAAFSANDSWQVTAQRAVPLSFAPLLGMSSATVKATAVAINSPAKSIPGTMVMPYAVWGGNSPVGLDAGTSGVIFRDNQYSDDVVKPNPCGGNNQPPCNPNWTVGSNDFKGYLHGVSGPITIGGLMSQGGNGFGLEPIAALCALVQSGTPAIFPVMGKGSGNGQVNLTVIGFIALKVNPFKGCGGPNGADVPWTGTVVHYDISGGTPGGPSNPGFPDVTVLKLWY